MPNLLTLPAELRNQIYDLVFIEQCPYTRPVTSPSKPRQLADFGKPSNLDGSQNRRPCPLLLTCRQLHQEAQLLHLQRTTFILGADFAQPEAFTSLCSTSLSPSLLSHIQHITLVGRIPRLRALNELWNGLPFANPHLSLKTLVIIPRRPASYDMHHAELADSSSAHTLSYILSETLKSLRNVQRLIVRNEQGCFSHGTWKVLYRSMVNRLLRWGGKLGSCRFRWDHGHDQGEWFEVLVDGRSADETLYRDAEHEFERLMSS